MRQQSYNVRLTVTKGSTFLQRFTWLRVPENTPVDLTGWEARMQVRLRPRDASTVLDLSSNNGGISLGGVNGTIDLHISAPATEGFNFTTGVWAIELRRPADGFVLELLSGQLIVQLGGVR